MDLFDLTGKVAVVTGGTRGIGLMMARGLLQAGASVYISSRKPEAGKEAAGELSGYGRVVSIPADLSSEEECLRLAAEVGRSEERVHILVNNAGATWGAPLEEFPASAWDKVLNLNLKAPFFLTRAFLPLLEAAGTADDPARVINVGSIDGLRVPELPTYSYSASKAALHQLTRALARELGPRHITVNAVAPGPFESKMMAATLDAFGEQIAAASPLGRIGRADDMAGVAVYLSGRGGSYVTGAVIPVDGGIWAARLPAVRGCGTRGIGAARRPPGGRCRACSRRGGIRTRRRVPGTPTRRACRRSRPWRTPCCPCGP
jgi:NAD(P)-dependent dehydrogenase (short-subunit alcohol dehydrogenase family)